MQFVLTVTILIEFSFFSFPYQVKIPNIGWLLLCSFVHFLILCVLYYFKFNICGFWTIAQEKQDV